MLLLHSMPAPLLLSVLLFLVSPAFGSFDYTEGGIRYNENLDCDQDCATVPAESERCGVGQEEPKCTRVHLGLNTTSTNITQQSWYGCMNKTSYTTIVWQPEWIDFLSEYSNGSTKDEIGKGYSVKKVTCCPCEDISSATSIHITLIAMVISAIVGFILT